MVTNELKFYAQDLSILIVEDDIDLNEELVGLVSLFFQEVRFAYNGVEALKLYEKSAVDIVLSDIKMPQMNGIELAKKLKYLNDDQSIIIVSAFCELDCTAKLIDLGIQQFIRKPFRDEELLFGLLKVAEDIFLKKSLSEYDLSTDLSVLNHSDKKRQKIHQKAIQADTFIASFDDDIRQDIEHLLELDEEFESLIELIAKYKVQKEYIENITLVLTKIYTTLSQMEAIHTMALVIYDLASFLKKIEFDQLTPSQIQELHILEFIYEDISKFIQTVFVNEDTNDVHYLENSLTSSIQQLEQNIYGTQLEEEELELF